MGRRLFYRGRRLWPWHAGEWSSYQLEAPYPWRRHCGWKFGGDLFTASPALPALCSHPAYQTCGCPPGTCFTSSSAAPYSSRVSPAHVPTASAGPPQASMASPRCRSSSGLASRRFAPSSLSALSGPGILFGVSPHLWSPLGLRCRRISLLRFGQKQKQIGFRAFPKAPQDCRLARLSRLGRSYSLAKWHPAAISARNVESRQRKTQPASK